MDKDQNYLSENASPEPINFGDVLRTLLAARPAGSTLATKGAIVDVNGVSYNVRHNRIKHDGVLWMSHSDDPKKIKIIFLGKAYKLNGRRGIQKPLPQPQSAFELDGEIDAEKNVIISLDSRKGPLEVDAVLELLAKYSDSNNDIQSFKIQWDGDIATLLPISLLKSHYNQVRVGDDGMLVVNNFKAQKRAGKIPEENERETSTGIQKAVNISEGIVGEMDPEDIEISITDTAMQKYIRIVIEKTNGNSAHPLFREFYDWYVGLLLQIKKTREGLTHLLKVQKNEPLRVVVGAEYDAAFYDHDGALKQYRKTVQTHHHGNMGYPPARYNAFAPRTYTQVNPRSLSAETRHHVHFVNRDLLSMPQDSGYRSMAAAGVTELVDDMQKFSKINSPENILLSQIFGEKPEVASLRRAMVCLDSELPTKTMTGHIYTGAILKHLGRKLFAYRRQSDDALEKIDRAIFDFMSHVDFSKMISWPAVVNLIEKLKRLLSRESKDGNAQLEIQKLKQEIAKEIKLPGSQILDDNILERLISAASAYEECRFHVNIVFSMYVDYGNFEKARVGDDMIADLEEKMCSAAPYRAPDGNIYPTLTSYYLNPEVIEAEILRRYPELGL